MTTTQQADSDTIGFYNAIFSLYVRAENDSGAFYLLDRHRRYSDASRAAFDSRTKLPPWERRQYLIVKDTQAWIAPGSGKRSALAFRAAGEAKNFLLVE